MQQDAGHHQHTPVDGPLVDCCRFRLACVAFYMLLLNRMLSGVGAVSNHRDQITKAEVDRSSTVEACEVSAEAGPPSVSVGVTTWRRISGEAGCRSSSDICQSGIDRRLRRPKRRNARGWRKKRGPPRLQAAGAAIGVVYVFAEVDGGKGVMGQRPWRLGLHRLAACLSAVSLSDEGSGSPSHSSVRFGGCCVGKCRLGKLPNGLAVLVVHEGIWTTALVQ